MDISKFLRKYLRKTHRWLALPFAALILLVLLTRGSPFGAAIQQTQQVLLLVMALTGLYLFLLPWWTRWNRDHGRSRREPEPDATASAVRHLTAPVAAAGEPIVSLSDDGGAG